MSKSDDFDKIAKKYSDIKIAADTYGRVIGVRRLRPSEKTKLEELSPLLAGETTVTTPDGQVINVPNRVRLLFYASVTSIDGIPIPFPRTRGELDAIMDRLDDEGLAAIMEATAKFYEEDKPPADAPDPSPKDDVKNG